MISKIIEKIIVVWTMIMIVITIICAIGEKEHKILFTLRCIAVWGFVLSIMLLIYAILKQCGLLVSRTMENIKWKHKYNSKLNDSLIYENEAKEIKILVISTWTLCILLLLCFAIPNANDNASFIVKLAILWIVAIVIFFALSKFIKFLKLKFLKRKLEKENTKMEVLKEQIAHEKEKINLSYELQKEIDRAQELSEIVNATTNREEFYKGIEEIKNILRYLSDYEGVVDFEISPSYDLKQLEDIEKEQEILLEKRIQDESINRHQISRKSYKGEKFDHLVFTAAEIVINKGRASIGVLQREMKIGFNYASKIMNDLYRIGVVSEEDGIKPRNVLMSIDELKAIEENFDGEFEYYVSYTLANRAFISDDERQRIEFYNNKYDYMEGHDFERFCAALLEKLGYQNISVTPGSGDQGIDVLAQKDGIKYGIQCKCYSSDIGNKAVQEAFAGAKYYDCHVPVVLTNRYFTRSAKELAEKNNVLLWDRDKLNEMCESSNE